MLTLRPTGTFSPHVHLPRPERLGPDPEPLHTRLRPAAPRAVPVAVVVVRRETAKLAA